MIDACGPLNRVDIYVPVLLILQVFLFWLLFPYEPQTHRQNDEQNVDLNVR
jgi:hypothetical protein